VSGAGGRGSATVTHHWAETEFGPIHYVSAGSGDPVLLLHQTPRSWDEYRDVLPIIGREHRAIAMDSLGFGDSARPTEKLTIELLARGAVSLLDALEIERAAIVGHHTGGVIAFEIAATYPDRVSKLVLSSTPLIDKTWRARIGPSPRADVVTPSIDGSHALELWRKRQPDYPPDRIDLLERFLIDALKAGASLSAAGHAAVQTYQMDAKLASIRAQTLLVRPMADPYVVDDVPLLAKALAAPMIEVENGMIPLPDQLPETFAKIVLDFLRS
jgi:pimeloyl-ACP methyl ester carboxylesterase